MKETKVRITAIESDLSKPRQGAETTVWMGDKIVGRGHAAESDIIGMTIHFITEDGQRFEVSCDYDEDRCRALKKAAENREWLNMKYKTKND